MKPKDIFGLAVRLLGLFFLYMGLKAAAQMLDVGFFQDPDKDDIINGLMPVIFYLAVAFWLIHGGLIGWAYPETPKISEPAPSQVKWAAPQPDPVPAPALSGMDQAEKRLAALVEKPKDSHAA